MFQFLKYLNPLYWYKMHRLEHEALKRFRKQYTLLRLDLQDLHRWMHQTHPTLNPVSLAAHWAILRDDARFRDLAGVNRQPEYNVLETLDISGLREHLKRVEPYQHPDPKTPIPTIEERIAGLEKSFAALNLSDEDTAHMREYIALIKSHHGVQ